MDHLMLVLVSGIASGAVYGLMGLGLVIIYRATDVVNFALASHGDARPVRRPDASTTQGLAVVAGIAAAVARGHRARAGRPRGGDPAARRRAAVRRAGRDHGRVADRGGASSATSGARSRGPSRRLVEGTVAIGSADVREPGPVMIAVAGVAMLAVAYLFTRTTLGSAMRAVAESADTADDRSASAPSASPGSPGRSASASPRSPPCCTRPSRAGAHRARRTAVPGLRRDLPRRPDQHVRRCHRRAGHRRAGQPGRDATSRPASGTPSSSRSPCSSCSSARRACSATRTFAAGLRSST